VSAPTREQDPPEPLESRLDAVVAAAAEVLGVDSVGAMLLDAHGVLRLLGASDELAQLMERAQIDADDGPGLETTRTGADVAVADLVTASRWATVSKRLCAAGARAVLSSPILLGGVVVGNLNAIRRQPHVWTPSEIRAQRAYARVIGAMLTMVTPAGPDEPAPVPAQPDRVGPIAGSAFEEDPSAHRS
jgi:hypothetical protein